MSNDFDLDAVADACVELHALIERGGTPEMRAVGRVLLNLVGQEIARQNPSLRRVVDSDPDENQF